MDRKLELTIKQVKEALKLIDGRWPSNDWIKPNSFACTSDCREMDFKLHAKLRALGYEDIMMKLDQGCFTFHFIWQPEETVNKSKK